MERNHEAEVDLHQVRRILEVRLNAANELLERGWILHDVFFGTDDYRPLYVLFCLEETRCPQCNAPATIEAQDKGERFRYICSRECSASSWLENTNPPAK